MKVNNPDKSRRLSITAVAILTIGLIAFWAWSVSNRRKVNVPPPTVHSASSGIASRPVNLRRPDPPSQSYVGSKACAECHSDIYTKYQSHPMAHSLAAVEQATVVEDYSNAQFTSGSRDYRIERTPRGVFHHESMVDRDGQIIYDQGEQVHYALGSGQRGRSYLIDRGGLLFQSPIGWYSHGARWDLSPGYSPGSHARFNRAVGDGCLYCHAGRVAPAEPWSDRYQQPPFHELSIGCERCHGPGKEHVTFHSATSEGKVDPIVNPVTLDAERRESVCYQCHLQGEMVMARYGRSLLDFRPGQRLDDVWVVFVGHQAGSLENSAVSQVEQIRSSTCFSASNGRMGCISCHDPHSSPGVEEKESFYRSRCLNCHEDKGCSLPEPAQAGPPAFGSCTACHMPRLKVGDVAHTALTDHRILREAATQIPPSRPVARRHLTVFDEGEQRLPAWEVDRARGLTIMARHAARLDSDLLREAEALLLGGTMVDEQNIHHVVASLSDDVPAIAALGTICGMTNREAIAEDLFRRVLEIQPEHENALQWMIVLSRRQGGLDVAKSYLNRLLKVNPFTPDLYRRAPQLLEALGEQQYAIQLAEQGLQLEPTMIELREWLADAYGRAGQTERRDHQQDLLQRLKAVRRNPQ